MTTKVMDYDLVVLGAGGSGMVAAVKAADISGKKVIVLEKAKKPGGATTFAHGMRFQDTQWHKDAGETISDPPDISGQFFDWLVTKGDVEKYFKMAKPGEQTIGMGGISMPERLPKYRNHPDGSIGPGWVGTFVVEKMLECCKEKGIPVLTETRAKEFTTDADGRLTGVLADTPDGQIQINCRACFIGAGGFAGNTEKITKMFPEQFNNKRMHRFCPSTDEGDCIDMAERIGAHVDYSNAYILIGGPAHHPYSYSIYRIMRQPEVMSVNLNGERWMDETKELMGGYDTLAQMPKGEMFAVADNNIVEKLGQRLIDNPPEPSDLPTLRRFREEIAYEVALDEGGARGDHAKRADSLKELAVKMRIEPGAFLKAVERYNAFCKSGKDEDFGKNAEYLIPIEKPPFFAFWGQRFSETSHGGIAINDKGEVLDTNGEVMPGLFSGGDGTTIFGGASRGGPFGAPGAGAPGGGSPPQGGMPGGPGGQGGPPQGGGSPPEGGMPPQGGMPGGAGGPGGAAPGMNDGDDDGNILSKGGSPGGGLGGAINGGYKGGIAAGKYLAGL